MENDPFIDGLPIENDGSFHGKLLVTTRWYIHKYPSIIPSLSQQIIPSLNHIKQY